MAAESVGAPTNLAVHTDVLPAVLAAAVLVLLAVNALLMLLAWRGRAAAQRPPAAPAVDGSEPHPARGGPSHGRRTYAPGPALGPGTPVFGYVSVAQSDGPDSAAYHAQAEEIAAFGDAGALELVRIVRDIEPEHERAGGRPGLRYVLEELAGGTASGLVVAELRRLSGSAADLAPLLRWFDESDVPLVALDVELDTTTPEGKRTARTLVAVGEWEWERMSERTRRGLEQARAQGRTGHRPAVNDRPELSERIQALRAQGMTLQGIADVLNTEGVPTVRGGLKWRPSSVQTAAGYRRPIGGTRPAGLPPSRRFDGSPEADPQP